MKIGVAFDDVWILMEEAASLGNSSIEVIDCCKVPIDERFVDEGPEVLGRLEFRTAWRLIDQPNAVRDRKVFRAVPAGIVELKDNDAIAASAGLTREGVEQLGKERLVDPVREIPDSLSARGRDEADDVEPFVAMVTERDRPLANRRPNPTMDRLEAEPMLIRGPDLDRLVWMLLGFFGDRVDEFFYKPLPVRSLLPSGSWGAATGSTSRSL